MSDFDELIDVEEVLKQEQREKRALAMLLDKQREKKDHLLAVRINMGTTKRSYVTAASLEWVGQKVRFATELPMFKEHRDEQGRVKPDRETAAIIQQRSADWRRQYPMTLYLAKRLNHKFPPILLAVSQEWVDDPKADEWGADGKALRDSISASFLDGGGFFADIYISERDWLYAIDGQHRLMAIKGLVDLLTTGSLYPLTEEKKQKQPPITLEEIAQGSNGLIALSDLQKLLAEGIGMEIVPAVLKGETRQEALRRLRSTFVHVNRTAKPLSKGELALLDEDNGFAVVARLAMVTHPLLEDRVQLKKGQLSDSAPEFTTLETLEAIATNFLGELPPFQDWWPDKHSQMPMRPSEESLDQGSKQLTEYFDSLADIPSHRDVMNGAEPAKYRSVEGEANILFRPLGQLALAQAAGFLMTNRQLKLARIVQLISKAESTGALRYNMANTAWYGTAFDFASGTMQRGGYKLLTDLFVHLLGGGTADDDVREKLRSNFAEARRVRADADLALNLLGKEVPLAQIDLPTPW